MKRRRRGHGIHAPGKPGDVVAAILAEDVADPHDREEHEPQEEVARFRVQIRHQHLWHSRTGTNPVKAARGGGADEVGGVADELAGAQEDDHRQHQEQMSRRSKNRDCDKRLWHMGPSDKQDQRIPMTTRPRDRKGEGLE